MSHATIKQKRNKIVGFPFARTKLIAHDTIVNLEEKWLDKILGFNCGHSVLVVEVFLHHSLWTKNMI